MRSAVASREIDESLMEGLWPELNVHILYEDLAAGLRAKQTVDWLETQLELIKKVGIENYLQSGMTSLED